MSAITFLCMTGNGMDVDFRNGYSVKGNQNSYGLAVPIHPTHRKGCVALFKTEFCTQHDSELGFIQWIQLLQNNHTGIENHVPAHY